LGGLMKKTILIYGLSLAALVALLRFIEYRFFIHDLSLEFYVGTIALLFTGLGIWAGLRLTRRKTVLVNSNFVLNEIEIKRRGVSPRELEVLELIARGLSNQEIADGLFVSLNTIKTHTSNIFLKLEVKRRTQAIQKAKELQFIP
jgi:two-component system, NarL family, response regulator LiaR